VACSSKYDSELLSSMKAGSFFTVECVCKKDTSVRLRPGICHMYNVLTPLEVGEREDTGNIETFAEGHLLLP
jgi:hypothetical protein